MELMHRRRVDVLITYVCVLQITNVAMTEFCQGKTMRWGLAWTFDANMTFPVRISHTMRLTTECFHYVFISCCICMF